MGLWGRALARIWALWGACRAQGLLPSFMGMKGTSCESYLSGEEGGCFGIS
jgi:hypothetical protein